MSDSEINRRREPFVQDGDPVVADGWMRVRRHSPFLLPPATLFGFLLLIAGILASTVVAHPVYYSFLMRCLVGAPDPDGDVPAALGWADGADGDRAAADFWFTTVLLAAATAAQYWFLSAMRARGHGVRPVGPEFLPHLDAEVRRLAGRVVPGVEVRFLVDLLDTSTSGVVFGRVRRRQVLLGRGMIALLERDPDAFEAVVLHELAHLRNRDVDVTLITLGFARSFAVLVFAPAVMAIVGSCIEGSGKPIWGRVALVIGLAVLILLARGAVLIAREFHADARAVLWQGSPKPLVRVLRANEHHYADDSSVRIWRRWVRVHPAPRSRSAAVLDPLSAGMPIGFGFACVLGACLVLVWDPSTAPSRQSAVIGISGAWVSGLLTVPLVLVISLAALREALHAELHDRALGLPALRWGLAVGVGVGSLLSPGTMLESESAVALPANVRIIYAALLAGLGFLLVIWCEYVASTFSSHLASARLPMLRSIVPCAITTLVVLTCASSAFTLHARYADFVHAHSGMSHVPSTLLALGIAQQTLASHFSSPLWLLVTWLLMIKLLPYLRLMEDDEARFHVRPDPSKGYLVGPTDRKRRAWIRTAVALVSPCVAFATTTMALHWLFDGPLRLPGCPIPDGLGNVAVCAAVSAFVASLLNEHPIAGPMRCMVVIFLSIGLALQWEIAPGNNLVTLAYCFETGLFAALAVAAVTGPLLRHTAGHRPTRHRYRSAPLEADPRESDSPAAHDADQTPDDRGRAALDSVVDVPKRAALLLLPFRDRDELLESLVWGGDFNTSHRRLRRMLTSHVAVLRFDAALEFARRSDKQGLNVLLSVADDPQADPDQRWRAARGLERLHDPRGRDTLACLANDSGVDAPHRGYAALKLAEVDDPRGLEYLAAMARDTAVEDSERQRAALHLEKFGDIRGREALAAWLASDAGLFSRSHQETALMLAELGDSRGRDALVAIAGAPGTTTHQREEIAGWLGKLGDQRGSDVIVDLLSDPALDPRQRIHVAEKFPAEKRCRDYLHTMAMDPALADLDRHRAAQCLERLGDERGLDALAAMAGDPVVPEVDRISIALELEGMADARGRQVLLGMANDRQVDVLYRVRAAQALNSSQ